MPAQAVELALQFGRVDVETVGQAEKSEVVNRRGRLHFAALLAEVRRTHVAAGPAVGFRRSAGAGDQDAAIVTVIGVRHDAYLSRFPVGLCGCQSEQIFVSGHDFSRAITRLLSIGLQPLHAVRRG